MHMVNAFIDPQRERVIIVFNYCKAIYYLLYIK